MGNDLFEKVERLERLESADTVRAWYDKFTEIMAARKHHSIIEGDDLDVVAKQIVALADKAYEASDGDEIWLATAALGRLAAIARGREDKVYAYIDEILQDEPGDIEMLADGDEKEYGAAAISHSQEDWVVSFCFREAIDIFRADKARKQLLQTALDKTGDVASFLTGLDEAFGRSILSEDDRARRRLLTVRRILSVTREVLNDWDGPVGDNVGEQLANLFATLVKPRSDELEDDEWFAIVDAALGCMLRIIELRFSFALEADTYAVLGEAKTALGKNLWLPWISKSEVAERVQICLLEAALVLARQGKQDDDFRDPLRQAFGDLRQIGSAMANHFRGAADLDPATRLWWEKAGNVRANAGNIEQRVGSGVDDQIGALLVEIESSKEGMERLGRAVVPQLKLSDPVLASNVDRTSKRFTEIAQIVRRLARGRKISLSETQGQEMEYNPREHVFVDGSQSGARRVRVIRDGVRKDFGGRVKTIVKAWVEPID